MIDLHAHVVLPEVLAGLDEDVVHLDQGEPGVRPPSFRVGDYTLEGVDYRGTAFTDVGLRLAAMEAAGVTFQVLSPNPLTYLTDLDPTRALGVARSPNDRVAALVATAPARLGGLAQLPTQDPASAASELHRSVTELGLLGAAISTDPGPALDDPALDDLWATTVELDVPLVLHPVPDGVARPVRDPRLARFDGDLWLGFAYEEALAVSTVVLGGVLDRHPGLDLCVSHGGGATSWIAERLEHAVATRPWADPALRADGAVARRLALLWWDAHVGGPRALAALVATVGDSRLVGGTNLAGWDEEVDPTHGDRALAATLDANARRLLRLDRTGRHRG